MKLGIRYAHAKLLCPAFGDGYGGARFATQTVVRPTGIEPVSQAPQACILSVELRAQRLSAKKPKAAINILSMAAICKSKLIMRPFVSVADQKQRL